MTRKKTLVALGYFGDVVEKPEKPKVAPGAIPKNEVTEDMKIVEQDLYFCKFCDKFFETLRGKEIHENRWCKEKK